ncbi:MAG TPA: DUF4388 domain-containing protein [Myxococcaceae bacterium]|nr:DUF4388 domain-containing protein [Myxococcaceae bacterium]
MAQPREILIADPDLESARLLSRAIRERGHRVHYARDGSRALEVAVLRRLDLALFDEACQLLEAETFVEILRSNPRTAKMPVVLTSASLGHGDSGIFRDGVVRKPFHLDEVLGRIDHLFRESQAAGDPSAGSEIEGHLSQLGIADLLQFLALNQRSGRLVLKRGADRGEIHLGGGRPMNAKIGDVDGEKALFRLLSWTEGTFSFIPGPPPPRARVDRPMQDALLEGMRHLDELKRLQPSLPSRATRLAVAPDVELPADRDLVTSQVLELLRRPRALGEVVDLSPATDLDVLSRVSALLHDGVLLIDEGAQEDAKAGSLLAPAEVHALRTRLFRSRAPMRTAVAKIAVCGGGPEAARRVLSEVPGLRRIALDPPALQSGFGTLGRYEISDALHVDFCALPATDAAGPLWRPFSAGMVGALLLDESPQAARMAQWLATELGVPIAVVGGDVPPLLQRASAGIVPAATDLLEALRAVLVQPLNPPNPRRLYAVSAPPPG